MNIVRVSKSALSASIALFASLVFFGNVTDYGSNWQFVHHVMLMDTIFPDATIHYRAISAMWLQQLCYILIIAFEGLTAVMCWWGALSLFTARNATHEAFVKAKRPAIIGLVIGTLLWQVAFMSIGGEWFGMWQSQTWNGIPSAFRFWITLLVVLVYVVMKDGEE